MVPPRVPVRIGLLASGSGSLFWQLFETFGDDPRVVFAGLCADAEDIGAVAHARAHGVPVVVVPRKGHGGRRAFNEALAATLAGWRVDAVLCTYNHILTAPVLDRWPGRIFNSHYAILPAFPGLGPIPKTLAHGARFAGATVHVVDATLDGGPPVIQAVVPVRAGDDAASLQHRLFWLNAGMMCGLVDWLADGRVHVGEDGDPRSVIIDDVNLGTWPVNPMPERFRARLLAAYAGDV